MNTLLWLAALAAGVGILAWLLRACEKRRWLNFRGGSGAPSGPGVFFQIQKLLEPSAAQVERRERDRELKRQDPAAGRGGP